MPRLARLYRHPIKAIGAEAIAASDLEPGSTMPWDRVWAVAHEAARLAPAGGWSPCANFVRGVKGPQLVAVSATTDTGCGRVALRHPGRAPLTVDPDTDGTALIDWIRPLWPAGRVAPVRVVRSAGRGMTDTGYPSVSVLSLASLRALESRLGTALDPRRFRGNLWLDDLDAWQEFLWPDRRLAVGQAVLEVREPITRCQATAVDPATGVRDADTLGALASGWGHRDFGVYAVVITGGRVAVGDAVRLQ